MVLGASTFRCTLFVIHGKIGRNVRKGGGRMRWIPFILLLCLFPAVAYGEATVILKGEAAGYSYSINDGKWNVQKGERSKEVVESDENREALFQYQETIESLKSTLSTIIITFVYLSIVVLAGFYVRKKTWKGEGLTIVFFFGLIAIWILVEHLIDYSRYLKDVQYYFERIILYI